MTHLEVYTYIAYHLCIYQSYFQIRIPAYQVLYFYNSGLEF